MSSKIDKRESKENLDLKNILSKYGKGSTLISDLGQIDSHRGSSPFEHDYDDSYLKSSVNMPSEC